jgi:hypothetical protein
MSRHSDRIHQVPADGVTPDGFFSIPGPWEPAHRPIPAALPV